MKIRSAVLKLLLADRRKDRHGEADFRSFVANAPSLSWEAYSCLAGQLILCLLRNRMFITIFTWFYPELFGFSRHCYILFFNIHFNIILSSKPRSTRWLLPSGIPTKSLQYECNVWLLLFDISTSASSCFLVNSSFLRHPCLKLTYLVLCCKKTMAKTP
jgi:hypothetical protein